MRNRILLGVFLLSALAAFVTFLDRFGPSTDPALLVGDWRQVDRSGFFMPGRASFSRGGTMTITNIMPPDAERPANMRGVYAPGGRNALQVRLRDSVGAGFRGSLGYSFSSGRLTLSFPGSAYNGGVFIFRREQ